MPTFDNTVKIIVKKVKKLVIFKTLLQYKLIKVTKTIIYHPIRYSL